MKTDVEWALLSPEGTYHKLCEPNFFVGREDDMDLALKVGFINFRFSFFFLSMCFPCANALVKISTRCTIHFA